MKVEELVIDGTIIKFFDNYIGENNNDELVSLNTMILQLLKECKISNL